MPSPHTVSPKAVLALAACLAVLAIAAGCTPAVQGSVAMNKGDYDAAVAYYDQALADSPDNSQLLGRKGQALFHAGHYAEAAQTLDTALDDDPTNALAALYLKLALIGKGEADQGFRVLTTITVQYKPAMSRIVREEAKRLQGAAVMPMDDLTRRMLTAWERGRKVQEAIDRDLGLNNQ